MSDWPDPLRDVRHCSFGGHIASQRFCDFYLWEMLLNDNPHIRGGIVELGTDKGGMSAFLWAQANARGLNFNTFDIVEPPWPVPGYMSFDIYTIEFLDAFDSLLQQRGPVFLLCDGGDKAREITEHGFLCPVGSIVVAHDWGTEVGPDDVPPFLEERYGDFCDQIGSMSRVFERR